MNAMATDREHGMGMAYINDFLVEVGPAAPVGVVAKGVDERTQRRQHDGERGSIAHSSEECQNHQHIVVSVCIFKERKERRLRTDHGFLLVCRLLGRKFCFCFRCFDRCHRCCILGEFLWWQCCCLWVGRRSVVQSLHIWIMAAPNSTWVLGEAHHGELEEGWSWSMGFITLLMKMLVSCHGSSPSQMR